MSIFCTSKKFGLSGDTTDPCLLFFPPPAEEVEYSAVSSVACPRTHYIYNSPHSLYSYLHISIETPYLSTKTFFCSQILLLELVIRLSEMNLVQVLGSQRQQKVANFPSDNGYKGGALVMKHLSNLLHVTVLLYNEFLHEFLDIC